MFTNEELIRLASKEFNQILASDKVLKELESSRNQNSFETFFILDALNIGTYKIGELPVKPLTLAKWSFLYMIKSPYVFDNERIEKVDINILLYILSAVSLKDVDISISDLVVASKDMINATNLTFDKIRMELYEMIKIAFAPLSMLIVDNTDDSSSKAKYNASWLTQIASIVAKESNERVSYILHDMPLSTVCYYYVNYQRNQSTQRHFMSEENGDIDAKIVARVEELSKEFLKGAMPNANSMQN